MKIKENLFKDKKNIYLLIGIISIILLIIVLNCFGKDKESLTKLTEIDKYVHSFNRYYNIDKVINEEFLPSSIDTKRSFLDNCEKGDQLLIENGKLKYIPKTDVMDEYECKKWYQKLVDSYNDLNEEIVSIVFNNFSELYYYFSVATKRAVYSMKDDGSNKINKLFSLSEGDSREIENVYPAAETLGDCDILYNLAINYKNSQDRDVIYTEGGLTKIKPLKDYYKKESIVYRSDNCGDYFSSTKFPSIGVNIDKELLISRENDNIFKNPTTNKPLIVNEVFDFQKAWLLVTNDNQLYLFAGESYHNLGTIKNIDKKIGSDGYTLLELSIELKNGQKYNYKG